MNGIDYISTRLESMIQQGISKPDIIRAIVDGDVPDGLTLKRLRHGIPDDWDEQRREFGFL